PAIPAASPAAPDEDKTIDIAPDGTAEKPAAAAANGEQKDGAVAAADDIAGEQAPEPPRLPDDPGVTPEDEAEKTPRRFRLF
ncbi:MAG: heme biosynthesis protein HemY, partial [Mesorhizobium sp.]